jgi:hypothetical protein
MTEECREAAAPPSVVEVRVTSSQCDKMPAGDTLVIVGPAIDYSRSGIVCLTAINAIYPGSCWRASTFARRRWIGTRQAAATGRPARAG